MQALMMAAGTLDRNSPEKRLRSVARVLADRDAVGEDRHGGGFAAADDWLWRMSWTAAEVGLGRQLQKLLLS